jgi:hypothetical protein
MQLFLRSTLACLILSVVMGCGKGGNVPGGSATPTAGDTSEKERISFLKQYGISYHNHMDAMDVGPSKADDLASYMENDERLLKPLRSGEYVLIWGVKLPDQKGAYKGAGDLVLGYLKDVPAKGGPVLMGDGKVVQMTAEEFKKAKLAQPALTKE